MSRKANHNSKVRGRIVESAAAAFRRDGFERTNIDALMRDAGLTRGAFYAHFPSKAALFAEAIAGDDLLLRLLRDRSTAAPDTLALGMAHLFRSLLTPRNFVAVSRAWGLPALMRDAALGNAEARAAYERMLSELLAEMARGTGRLPNAPRFTAAVAQACGAIAMAAACHTDDTRSRLLSAASDAISVLLQNPDSTVEDSGQALRTRPSRETRP